MSSLSLVCIIECNIESFLMMRLIYRKDPKFSDTSKLCCNHPKNGKKRFYHRVMHHKDADSVANSEDPDQTAPLGPV